MPIPTLVLCKKRLQKRANIRKMTRFRKWPKLAAIQRHLCKMANFQNCLISPILILVFFRAVFCTEQL